MKKLFIIGIRFNPKKETCYYLCSDGTADSKVGCIFINDKTEQFDDFVAYAKASNRKSGKFGEIEIFTYSQSEPIKIEFSANYDVTDFGLDIDVETATMPDKALKQLMGLIS